MSRSVVLALLGALVLGGCASSGSESAAPSAPSSSPVKTLTMLPAPERTLSGELTAELQQSSRDVALGRFQVWITNGLHEEIRPRRVVYRDALLTRPVEGERLRAIPSGSYRGYPLELVEPTCRGEEAGATVTVVYRPEGTDGTESVEIPVEDETQVVGRWSKERCAERAIKRVAALEWSPGMRVEGSGADAVALFRLTAHPTGRGGSFTIDTVTGTPLYTSADGDFWTVDELVTGTGPETTIELPAQPARCDIHAFGSATGGTTFFVNVTIDGKPAQVRIAMSPEVTDEAFSYAAEVCGF
ncbi:MAG TPA: hypothetical protein VFR56_00570 [Actinomycetes bacterium]|nr:hypothetical protein [Actinomycetes bacterium]